MTSRIRPPHRTAASVILAAGLCAAAHAQPVRFSVIPSFGNQFAPVRAISADGSIVAGEVFSLNTPSLSVRWVYPGPTLDPVGLFNAQSTSVDHLSRTGQTVFGGTVFGAYRWTAPGPIQSDPDGRTMDLTPDGAVRIVSNKRQVGANPPTDLGAPNTYNSALLQAIDATGTVIIGEGIRVQPGGGYGDPDLEFREAARWNEATGWQRLGFLPGHAYSRGFHISDDGAVLIGTSQTDEDGVEKLWRKVGNAPMTDLGTLPGFEGLPILPVDMSADGSVIVGAIETFPRHFFVWTADDGMTDLDTMLRNSGQDIGDLQFFDLAALSANGQYLIGRVVTPLGAAHSFIAPIFATCDAPAGSLAQTYDIIAQLDAPAVGEPGLPTYTNLFTFPPPNVSEDGIVAHIAQMSDAATTLFVGPPPAPVRVGNPAPAGGTFSSLQESIIKLGGTFALRATITEGLDTKPGIWSRSAPGAPLDLIAKAGSPIATGSTSIVESFIGSPLHNNAGATAFIASFTSSFTFFAGVPGTLDPYFISAATRAPFPPDASFTNPALRGFNDNAQIVLTESITYAGVSPSADSCIMVRSPAQTTNMIRVLEGEQAPGELLGVTFAELTAVKISINIHARIAFACNLSSGETAVFVETSAGLSQAARTGQQAFGEPMGVTFHSVGTPLLNDEGDLVFTSVLIDPSGEAFQALWKMNAQSPETLAQSPSIILRTGVIAPALITCRDIFEILPNIALNNAGQVLAPVNLGAAGGSEIQTALYLHDPDQGLVLIAATDAALTLALGDTRTIRSIVTIGSNPTSTSAGSATPLSDQGHILFNATFTDDTNALIRATVPPPVTVCPGDADNNGSVNFADITNVLTFFGATYPPGTIGQGDANHDGTVNFADITSILTNFGLPCP